MLFVFLSALLGTIAITILLARALRRRDRRLWGESTSYDVGELITHVEYRVAPKE